jgi:PAS domain-containing protein
LKPPFFEGESQLAEELGLIAACATTLPGMLSAFHVSPQDVLSFRYASESVADLYGFTREEVTTDFMPLAMRFPADDQARWQGALTESRRTLSKIHLKLCYKHPSKGMVSIETWANPVPDPEGGVLWLSYTQDITDRISAEQKLRARSRAFLGSNLLGVCYVNSASDVMTEANDNLIDVLGNYHRAFAAAPIDSMELNPKQCLIRDENMMTDSATADRAQNSVEGVFIGKDGTRFPIRLARALLDAETSKAGVFVRDVLEQKHNEEKIQELYEEKISALKSMTAELGDPITAARNYLGAARRLLGMEPQQRAVSVSEALDKASAQIVRASRIITSLKHFLK